MKKFRLIREYPGSPKLETIVLEEASNYESKSDSFSKNSIENYPEFWEKVVEKDYEILKREYIPGNCREYNTEKHQYKIISIKRLSDGEMFTIGDNVINKTNSLYHGVISKIYISNNKLELYVATTINGNMGLFLNNVEKVKQPLFTTEDGVDIFKGDKTYYVFNDLTPECNSGFKCKWKVRGGFYQNYQVNQGNEYYKVFSTKEKAEEYILLNKPCLSINDILSCRGELSRSFLINKAINLAQQKLNNNK